MAGSLKDTTKAITAAFSSSPKIRALPDDLIRILGNFVEKNSSISDYDSQKLHEDLLVVYRKYVLTNDPTKGKFAAFVQVLKILLPTITTLKRKQEWWDLVVQPVLNTAGHTRDAIEAAQRLALTMMEPAEGQIHTLKGKKSDACHFFSLVLNAYLGRTQINGVAETANAENAFIAKQLMQVLLDSGHSKQRRLLDVLDGIILDRNTRLQGLSLLCQFQQSRPPHLDVVRDTQLMEHLLDCLMVDTSTTDMSLALNGLIMFLPHIPVTVLKHLPKLFIIYARLLCWDQLTKPAFDTSSQPYPLSADDEKATTTWSKLDSSFDTAESEPPDLLNYFTFLYGLYPQNFTGFIRDPKKYLKNVKFRGADELWFDDITIKDRSDAFQRMHILHPSILKSTSEDELTDQRWMKPDSTDVVAFCISLRLTQQMVSDAVQLKSTRRSLRPPSISPSQLRTEDIPPQSLLDPEDHSLFGASSTDLRLMTDHTINRSQHSHINVTHGGFDTAEALHLFAHPEKRFESPATQSPVTGSPHTIPQDAVSPTLSAYPPPSYPAASLDGDHQNYSVLSGSTQADRSPYSSSTLQKPLLLHPARSPALRPAPEHEARIAFLQRENMLLRNDLNFERFLKQEHLSHIGRLQRKQIRTATDEAEMEQLRKTKHDQAADILKLRTLVDKYEKNYQPLTKEALSMQEESNRQLRNLNEMRKKWELEEVELRDSLKKAKADCDRLRQLVVESEAKELLARQEIAANEMHVNQFEALQMELREKETQLKAWEARELEFERSRVESNALAQERANLERSWKCREAGYGLAASKYKKHIQTLEEDLRRARDANLESTPGELPPYVQRTIDNALAELKTKNETLSGDCTLLQVKYRALEKQNTSLLQRQRELEARCMDLEQEAGSRGLSPSTATPPGGVTVPGTSSKLTSRKNSVPTSEPFPYPTSTSAPEPSSVIKLPSHLSNLNLKPFSFRRGTGNKSTPPNGTTITNGTSPPDVTTSMFFIAPQGSSPPKGTSFMPTPRLPALPSSSTPPPGPSSPSGGVSLSRTLSPSTLNCGIGGTDMVRSLTSDSTRSRSGSANEGKVYPASLNGYTGEDPDDEKKKKEKRKFGTLRGLRGLIQRAELEDTK